MRVLSIPFEKLVFLIIPFSLNTLPAIVQLAYKKQPTPMPMALSVICFVGLGAGGFVQPKNELFWTLSAALVPVVVAAVSPFFGSKMKG